MAKHLKRHVWTELLNKIIQDKMREHQSPVQFEIDALCVSDSFDSIVKELIKGCNKGIK